MNTGFESFLLVIKKLESAGIPYMVVGSIASMAYGEPRLTHDMDLVIDLPPQDADKFEELFTLDQFYCPPNEVIRTEVVHRGQFNLIHHDSGLKVDVVIRKMTPHAKEEFTRRQRIPLWEGVEVFVASPEDVILKKLDFLRQGGSEKHITDIRGILSQTQIDQNYLNHWIKELGLEREWQLTLALPCA
ncbi:MAG: nucleotidyl transferase AbiEii/AbiGii toxin family protein [Bdellovibrionota bacterium]